MIEGSVMHTVAPALAVVAALMWPAAASAQSLADIAQREAARKKAEAQGSGAPVATALPSQTEVHAAAQGLSTAPVSLAEIARREAARRKALAASRQRPVVVTTSDVKKWEPPQETPKTEAANPDQDAKGDAKSVEKAAAPDAQPQATDATKGEEYWHGRVAAAREELRRNESFAEALQSRINALSAEFAAKDDPYQRAQIADDRQKALAELDRLTQDIDKNKKAISQIEEDARRAGVPAGWIR